VVHPRTGWLQPLDLFGLFRRADAKPIHIGEVTAMTEKKEAKKETKKEIKKIKVRKNGSYLGSLLG
jgi:hypothetical protein